MDKTTPLFLCLGVWSLGCRSLCLRVLLGLKETGTLCCPKIFFNFSDIPATYGMRRFFLWSRVSSLVLLSLMDWDLVLVKSIRISTCCDCSSHMFFFFLFSLAVCEDVVSSVLACAVEDGVN
ncbi:hypothetical protein LDENG_00184440 [Lucifuga dentata]|nr:hypothetical protein LDENG_00184440 [Lucifuga dentata]